MSVPVHQTLDTTHNTGAMSVPADALLVWRGFVLFPLLVVVIHFLPLGGGNGGGLQVTEVSVPR